MKDERILVVSCTICIIAMIVATISTPAVKIKRNSPFTHFEIVSKDKMYSVIGSNNNAITKWNFKIKTKIKGSTINKEYKNGIYRLKFKIDSIAIETSLPIYVFLPIGASEDLKSHEQGHVTICKNVYEASSKELPLLLEKLLKKTFTAEGITFESALEKALKSSNNWLTNKYNQISNDRVAVISEYYDKLSKDSNDSTMQLVNRAMQGF